MTTNPYLNNLNNLNTSEQNLYRDLIIEFIQAHGHDFYYLPRSFVNKDNLFGEDALSEFNSSKTIEMYIEEIDGWAGEGEFIAKFGLEIRDSATFTLSKKRFEDEFTDTPSIVHPREGDLVYFPLTDSLLEITFVEHENPFYQIGKNFVYRLTVEMFDYSHESFDTGQAEIDDLNAELENLDDSSNDPFADNTDIENEADDIQDSDKDNPFGGW